MYVLKIRNIELIEVTENTKTAKTNETNEITGISETRYRKQAERSFIQAKLRAFRTNLEFRKVLCLVYSTPLPVYSTRKTQRNLFQV